MFKFKLVFKCGLNSSGIMCGGNIGEFFMTCSFWLEAV